MCVCCIIFPTYMCVCICVYEYVAKSIRFMYSNLDNIFLYRIYLNCARPTKFHQKDT